MKSEPRHRRNRRQDESTSVRARAAGKIILLGEHAVVYGEPAIGVPLSRGVSVELTSGRGLIRARVDPDPRARLIAPSTSLSALVDAALGELRARRDIAVRFEIPPMAGLGSSAAMAVALLHARSALLGERPSRETLLREATRVEDVAHGRSSGVDPAIALSNRPIIFTRDGDVRRLRKLPLSTPLFLVVGARGGHGGTGRSVGRVADLRSGAPRLFAQIMSTLGEATKTGTRALARGDLSGLGRALDLAHGVLSGLGLVSEAIEEVVRSARHAGALGAKMSGAGGAGGAFVALAADRRTAERVQRAVTDAGALGWIERAGP